jgi:hypothetical protein
MPVWTAEALRPSAAMRAAVASAPAREVRLVDGDVGALLGCADRDLRAEACAGADADDGLAGGSLGEGHRAPIMEAAEAAGRVAGERGRWSGSDGVDGDTAFACGVRGMVLVGKEPGDRGEVDDAAVALGDHERAVGPAEPEGADLGPR